MSLNPLLSKYQLLVEKEPGLAVVAEVREVLRSFLVSKAMGSANVDDALLVVSEHFSNVVKHSSRVSRLELGVIVESDRIVVLLRDDGDDISTAFDVQGPSDIGTGLLRTEGMGLSLIAMLAPDLRYTGKSDGDPVNMLAFDIPVQQFRPSIVVIDDDEVQLCIVELFLEQHFIVKCFTDPHLALAHIFREGTDLILSDIYMPGLDGVLLRKRLAANDETCRIPFIFLSGCTERQIREQANALSIDDFIAKPVEKEALLATVRRVLTRAKDVANRMNIALDRSVTEALWQPLPPRFAGYHLSRAYRVASRGGGDILIPRLDAQGLTLVLVDVMGHGDQAKFFVHALAGFFHGLFAAFPGDTDPAVHLIRLSQATSSHPLLSGSLLTCQVIHISPEGGVRIASAGHPLPLRWTDSSRPAEIQVHGVLPGLSATPSYESVEVRPEAGECLLFYTDGLFEYSRQGRTSDADSEQLLAAVAQCPRSSLDADQIAAEFDRLAGPSPCDDATMLVIRRE